MANELAGRVGILWRGDRADNQAAIPRRLVPVFDALTSAGIVPERVVYSDDAVSDVYDQLLRLDGVLVWVDPISGGRDRSRLDPILRDAAANGTWVSAHPDVILTMGTKEVLFRTRTLGCGGDIRLYDSYDAFKEQFPPCLASSGPRVIKQNRGNGGIGVWKVELVVTPPDTPTASLPAQTLVRVQDAAPRDVATEDLSLDAFTERCRGYFDGGGIIVDQPFQPRIVDGMIRCYMIQDAVAGFASQSPSPAYGEAPGAPHAANGAQDEDPSRRVLGLPAAKTMFNESEPRLQDLRRKMESEWLPGLQRLLGLDTSALPLLWDADFLYGPKTDAGADTYVLCEINVSCVTPFPDTVPSRLARAVRTRLTSPAAST